MRRLRHDDWVAEGRERFGEDSTDWKYVCPSCGQVQSLRDFLAAGTRPREASTVVGFACVGRANLSTAARDLVVEFGEPTRGAGCRYLSNGLFPISPVEVWYYQGQDLQTRPSFEWADPEAS